MRSEQQTFPRTKIPSPSKNRAQHVLRVTTLQPVEGVSRKTLDVNDDIFTSPPRMSTSIELHKSNTTLTGIADSITKALIAKSSAIDFGFTLFDSEGQRSPGGNELALIRSAFPGCIGITLVDMFLVIRFATMADAPPKTWPRYVAGLLLRLETMKERQGDYVLAQGHHGQRSHNPSEVAHLPMGDAVRGLD